MEKLRVNTQRSCDGEEMAAAGGDGSATYKVDMSFPSGRFEEGL